jgi:hypothetical protein
MSRGVHCVKGRTLSTKDNCGEKTGFRDIHPILGGKLAFEF